jgi:hypothetical protein
VFAKAQTHTEITISNFKKNGDSYSNHINANASGQKTYCITFIFNNKYIFQTNKKLAEVTTLLTVQLYLIHWELTNTLHTWHVTAIPPAKYTRYWIVE